MALRDHFQSYLDSVCREDRYRTFVDLARRADRPPFAIWRNNGTAREVVVWCSNDYLGMGRHPAVINAMIETAVRMGVGAGGTRNISGNSHAVLALEAELADLHEKDAALVFTSGYVSNEAGLGTIGRLLPNCLVLSDEKNHASMIAGIRASGAEKRIFRHNDLGHLEQLLKDTEPDRPKLIAFELRLFDGWRYRPNRADLRSGRKIRRSHLSRRGPRRWSLRAARRRHRRARRGHGPRRRHRRNTGQRLRRRRRLYRRRCGDLRCNPLRGAELYFHDGDAAGGRRRCPHNSISASEENRWRNEIGICCRWEKTRRALREAGIPMMPSQSHIIPVPVGDPALCREASTLLLERFGITSSRSTIQPCRGAPSGCASPRRRSITTG